MNREEQLAKAYLEALQSGKVVFEPLGKTTTPDFSLGNHIGVEIRRLNENYFGGGHTEGLEQVDLPVWKALNEAIESFEGGSVQRSYWVMAEFERPLGLKGKKLRSDIKRALADALPTASNGYQSLCLDVRIGLRLWLYPSTITTNNPFRAMGSSDMDSGGMVTKLYAQNIEHCIAEKGRKILPVRNQFEEWWLLLVDSLHHGLPDYEMATVEQSLPDLGVFTRVILLDYHGQETLLALGTGPSSSAV